MYDLHTHSRFSDGRDSAEDMVLEALERGMSRLGISDHSHVPWEEGGMSWENTAAFRKEMSRLKERYRNRISLLCGLERDYYSDDALDYDYIIGSVHCIMMPDGHPLCVDWEPRMLEEDVEKYFHGDWYAMTEAYYAVEADVARKTRCDIIGHFDLVTKFNEKGHYWDESDPRYVRAWQGAADALLKTGAAFEVNTGAISRGYRTEPYPARIIREYLWERGARLILSSDAHRREHLAFGFEELVDEIKLFNQRYQPKAFKLI